MCRDKTNIWKNRNLKPGKHGLKANTMSDVETSVHDDGSASPPAVAVPQSDPILKETWGGENNYAKKSELEKQTANSINNPKINNGT